MRRMSTSAASGRAVRFWSIAASRRRNYLWPRDPSSFPAGFARHYVTMTSPAPELQQIANPAPAYRMAAMLLGMGSPAFRGAQAVRHDHPRRTAGQPAVLHLCLWRCGGGHRRAAAGAAHPPARRAGRGRAVRRRCSRPTSTWCGCGGTSRWPMRLAAIARLPLQIPMITAGAQGLPQLLSRG